MAERQNFKALQRAFAAHIRDPQNSPPPENIEDRRMAIYRDLFFNNVVSLLAGTFPVLRRILGEDDWRRLVRDYFSIHRSHTPYFLEMPQEFLHYLQNERERQERDPDWLLELAHYEWVELALAISEEEPDWDAIDRDGDLLGQRPVLSPLAWPLSYRYPVHRIGPQFQPSATRGGNVSGRVSRSGRQGRLHGNQHRDGATAGIATARRSTRWRGPACPDRRRT